MLVDAWVIKQRQASFVYCVEKGHANRKYDCKLMVFGTIVFYGLFPFDISGNLDYKETEE